MASSNVGKWSATAGVDAGGFGTGVTAMIAQSTRAERAIQSSFGRMSTGVQSSLGGLFGSIPGLLGIGSITAFAAGLKNTLDQEIDLAFLNDQLGTTITWLSTLRTVAGENSVTAQQFTAGMERLNQQIGQARLGSSEAAAAFERLGLSVEEMETRSFQDNFTAIARGLADIEDRSIRARTAMELFGRGGAAGMLRLVENLDQSMADVQSRGGFVTEADLARFQEMNTNVDRMTTSLNNTWRAALGHTAAVLNPVLSGSIEDFEGPMPEFLRGVGDGLNALRQSMEGADITGPPSVQVGQDEMGRMLAETRALDAEAMFAAQSLTAFVTGVDEGANAVERAADSFETLTESLSEMTAAANRDASAASRIFDQTRTPVEQFGIRIEELSDLFNRGYIDMQTFERATRQAFDTVTRGTREERRLPGMVTFGSSAATSQVNQTQSQIRDRMDTLVNVSRDTRDALRDLIRANPEVQGILGGRV